VSAAEVIMTQLHAGGKFDQNLQGLGGLHGVGVSVVNALSEWLELRIWRDGKEHYRPLRAWRHGGAAARRRRCRGGPAGTEVRFLASTKTFSNLEYKFATLENRLRELAFLNSGVKIELTDERPPSRCIELFYDGGVREFVKYLDRHKHPLIPNRSSSRASATGSPSRSRCGGTTATTRRCCPSPTTSPAGRRHASGGLPRALTRTMNLYAGGAASRGEGEGRAVGDDAREGLTCVLSVKVPDPKFSSQTKDKLVSSEVRPAVEKACEREAGRVVRGEPPGNPADDRGQDREAALPARRRARRAK
jgi:DNA gyrase subunit B